MSSSVITRESKRKNKQIKQIRTNGKDLSVDELSTASYEQLLERYGMKSSLKDDDNDDDNDDNNENDEENNENKTNNNKNYIKITKKNYISPYELIENYQTIDNLSYIDDKKTWKIYDKFSSSLLSKQVDHLVKLIYESILDNKPDNIEEFIALDFFSSNNIETFRTDFL